MSRASKSASPMLLPPLHTDRLVRDTLILAIAQRQVHVLQTLRRGSLEQVIDRRVHDDTLARAVDCEAANLDAVFAGDVLYERGLADDADELLASIAVLEDVADVAGGHGAVERDGDGVLKGVSDEEKEGDKER